MPLILLVSWVIATGESVWGQSFKAESPQTSQNLVAFYPVFNNCKPSRDNGSGNRIPEDPLVPYIIAPRRTTILDAQPLLQWNHVANATRYQVEVVELLGGGSQNRVWQTETEVAQVRYGGPVLQSGKQYLLIVRAPETDRSSLEEEVSGISFEVLNPDDAAHVQELAGAIAALNTTATEKALLTTQLYVGYHLNAEAIAALDALPDTDQTVTVHRLLGDLYDWTDLQLPAGWSYHAAARVAEPGTAQLAAVQARLGQLYADFDEPAQARQWWEAALETYQTLGNTQRIAEIRALLSQL
ncbi:MAG: hypothetical protein AAGG51_09085 [Cyanobacteria bacterium P01_G01_bin.54]